MNTPERRTSLMASFTVFIFNFNRLKICKVPTSSTAQKMKFSIKDFFRKCDQIRRKGFGHIY